MIHPNTYETYLEIAGYEYEVIVKFHVGYGEVEISDISIKADDGSVSHLPYLSRVENSLMDEIQQDLLEQRQYMDELKAESQFDTREEMRETR